MFERDQVGISFQNVSSKLSSEGDRLVEATGP
jgi:hypothetical protein